MHGYFNSHLKSEHWCNYHYSHERKHYNRSTALWPQPPPSHLEESTSLVFVICVSFSLQYFHLCMSLNSVVYFNFSLWIESHYTYSFVLCFILLSIMFVTRSIYEWNAMTSAIWLKTLQRWRSCKVYVD